VSRNRKWWHKTNHDRVMRDQFVWSLPDRALGLLMRLECMTGSTDEGCASGILCAEDGSRVPLDDLLYLLSRGDDAREQEIQADLKLLARTKQVCARALERGQVKLLNWEADQEMPASQDNARKRSAADEKMFQDASGWGDELERLSGRLGGRRAFSEGELLSYIKARRNGYLKTNLKFLEFLVETGVCQRAADGLVALASLASDPPAGVGFSGAGDASQQDAGAGSKISPDGKFPKEREPEREARKERHSSFQLDSAGGGGSDASEASACGAPDQEGPAFCRTPAPAGSFCELHEPGDAYRCPDPLRASIDFLSRCPGWCQTRCGDRPCSATVMRARWRDLRASEHVGAVETDRIWRVVLDQAITDRLDKQGWRNWVGLFLKRVERQVEFCAGVPAE